MYFERQAHHFPATTNGCGANDIDHDDAAAAGPSSSEASWDIDAIINSATTQVTDIAPVPDVVSNLQASPTKKQKLSASTGAITKKNTKLRRMTVVKVHAPTGFLGFILKAKKHNRAGDYRSQKSIRLVL